MENGIKIGWAQTNITPDRPVFVAGQMYPRISSYVHDPLTAAALALDNGDTQYVMVSLDMVNVPARVVARFRQALEGIDGLDPQNVSFSATHTHNSLRGVEDPHLNNFTRFLGKDIIPEFDPPKHFLYGDDEAAFLADRVKALVRSAWEARAPGGIGAGSDYAPVAFNRRPVFDRGGGLTESKMYGACSSPDFLRLEGASDHSAEMLYTFAPSGALTGVLVNIPCPSQVYELHCFLSSDYWHDARTCIRERLGNIFILPVCGAGGDQNPLDLVRLSKTNESALRLWNEQAGEVFREFDMARECRLIGERIADAVVRGYAAARNDVRTAPEFRHVRLPFSMPIRRVSEADRIEAEEKIEKTKKLFSEANRMTMHDLVKVFEPIGVLMRWERQNSKPLFDFDAHVTRLGDMAIATNPFELFTEYGMRIKAKCRARQVVIAQLTDDAGVYLPTDAAINGGSYSSKPATTLVGPREGDTLAARTVEAIDLLFT